MYLYSRDTGGFYLRGLHPQIPSDAIEISAEEHAALMDAQAGGQQIVPGDNGRPALARRAPDAGAQRGRRDALLAASDWTQLADAPLSPEQRAAWAGYRAALRDLPDDPGFPDVAFPAAPT